MRAPLAACHELAGELYMVLYGFFNIKLNIF